MEDYFLTLDGLTDELSNIIYQLNETFEEMESELNFINNFKYINIDDLIKLLENENLINNELREFLERLVYRRNL